MRSLFLVFTLLMSVQLAAISKAHFLGMQGMISITHANLGGNDGDTDAQNLFNLMNVPIQGSVLGPGKAIIAGDKIMNLSCVNRGNAGFECSIVLQRSPQSLIDSQRRIISFKATGAEANTLLEKFNLENGRIQFHTTDGLFQVFGEPNLFLLQYKEN